MPVYTEFLISFCAVRGWSVNLSDALFCQTDKFLDIYCVPVAWMFMFLMCSLKDKSFMRGSKNKKKEEKKAYYLIKKNASCFQSINHRQKLINLITPK